MGEWFAAVKVCKRIYKAVALFASASQRRLARPQAGKLAGIVDQRDRAGSKGNFIVSAGEFTALANQKGAGRTKDMRAWYRQE